MFTDSGLHDSKYRWERGRWLGSRPEPEFEILRHGIRIHLQHRITPVNMFSCELGFRMTWQSYSDQIADVICFLASPVRCTGPIQNHRSVVEHSQ